MDPNENHRWTIHQPRVHQEDRTSSPHLTDHETADEEDSIGLIQRVKLPPETEHATDFTHPSNTTTNVTNLATIEVQPTNKPPILTTSATESIPFLRVSGVRPLLTILLTLSAYVHLKRFSIEIAETAAFASDVENVRSDCSSLESYVGMIGIMSLAILIGVVHLLPFVTDPIRSTRRRYYFVSLILQFSLLATIPIIIGWTGGALGSIYHDQCWHDQELREWVLADCMMVTFLLTLISLHHLLHASIDRCCCTSFRRRAFDSVDLHPIRRYARLLVCSITLLMLLLKTNIQFRYEKSLFPIYQWSFLDRPNECSKECFKTLPPDHHAEVCLNGNLEPIAKLYCVEQLPLDSRPSVNHTLFQPCPNVPCLPGYRYNWAPRHERFLLGGGRASHLLSGTDSSSQLTHRCSRHDHRTYETVIRSFEWQCMDNRKTNWMEDAPCMKSKLPFPHIGSKNNNQDISFTQRHCTDACWEIKQFTNQIDLIGCLILISSIITFMARMWNGLHWNSYDMVLSSTSSSTTSSVSNPVTSTSSDPPGSLRTLFDASIKRQLARRVEHGWLITRCWHYFYFMHLYGLGCLSRTTEMLITALLCLVISVSPVVGWYWVIWSLDASCTFYSIWIGLFASITTALFSGVLLRMIHALQAPTIINNLQQD